MTERAIYLPFPDKDFELCHPVDGRFEAVTDALTASGLGETWKPIAMRLVREDEKGRALAPSDSPWFGADALIFRKSAMDALDNVLQKNGQLFPLTCADADVSIHNSTTVLDGLDDAASTLVRFGGNGRIMMVKRYVFREDVVAGADMFKLTNIRGSSTFVSQRFVDAWQQAGLKGLVFKQIWAPN